MRAKLAVSSSSELRRQTQMVTFVGSFERGLWDFRSILPLVNKSQTTNGSQVCNCAKDTIARRNTECVPGVKVEKVCQVVDVVDM